MDWMDAILASDSTSAGNYYDKACLLTRMKRFQEALQALHDALEKGYRSFAHIEHDDDMDPLRSLPEFQSLIHCCPEKFYHKVGCSTEPASGTLTGVVG